MSFGSTAGKLLGHNHVYRPDPLRLSRDCGEKRWLVAWGAGELCSPRTIAGGHGEAEREGASAASGCGGEGAGPEVPEGGSERGRGGRWGAEGQSEPFQGSHISAMVTSHHGLAMVIKVQLRDPQTGSETTFAFDQSPIRVGRNALNNVVIEDRFVSQWHGMVRFDDSSVTYFDLGSTNGTRLAGKRLARNTAVSLGGSAQLGISRFELRVTADPAAPGAASTEIMKWGEPQQGGPPLAPPAATPSQSSEPDRLARSLRVLEGFSDAFVALKKGYEEFGAEVGVRPLAGSTPLHRARTGREVMDHLLAPARDVEVCLLDLKAVFADMGIHHIALMEGITQGIRALLESLDPSTQDAGSGLFSRWRSKARWASYQERFTTLIAEDAALHAELFGEQFARAYASVALGSAGPPDHSDG